MYNGFVAIHKLSNFNTFIHPIVESGKQRLNRRITILTWIIMIRRIRPSPIGSPNRKRRVRCFEIVRKHRLIQVPELRSWRVKPTIEYRDYVEAVVVDGVGLGHINGGVESKSTYPARKDTKTKLPSTQVVNAHSVRESYLDKRISAIR